MEMETNVSLGPEEKTERTRLLRLWLDFWEKVVWMVRERRWLYATNGGRRCRSRCHRGHWRRDRFPLVVRLPVQRNPCSKKSLQALRKATNKSASAEEAMPKHNKKLGNPGGPSSQNSGAGRCVRGNPLEPRPEWWPRGSRHKPSRKWTSMRGARSRSSSECDVGQTAS